MPVSAVTRAPSSKRTHGGAVPCSLLTREACALGRRVLTRRPARCLTLEAMPPLDGGPAPPGEHSPAAQSRAESRCQAPPGDRRAADAHSRPHDSHASGHCPPGARRSLPYLSVRSEEAVSGDGGIRPHAAVLQQREEGCQRKQGPHGQGDTRARPVYPQQPPQRSLPPWRGPWVQLPRGGPVGISGAAPIPRRHTHEAF